MAATVKPVDWPVDWGLDLGSAPASATMREMCVFRFAAEPGGP